MQWLGVGGIDFETDLLDREVVCKSLGHAIEGLKLPCQIMHPDSVKQMKRESFQYSQVWDRAYDYMEP